MTSDTQHLLDELKVINESVEQSKAMVKGMRSCAKLQYNFICFISMGKTGEHRPL